MTFDRFPLADGYPSESTREAVQRVRDTAISIIIARHTAHDSVENIFERY